jgi:hypothetical protein
MREEAKTNNKEDGLCMNLGRNRKIPLKLENKQNELTNTLDNHIQGVIW